MAEAGSTREALTSLSEVRGETFGEALAREDCRDDNEALGTAGDEEGTREVLCFALGEFLGDVVRRCCLRSPRLASPLGETPGEDGTLEGPDSLWDSGGWTREGRRSRTDGFFSRSGKKHWRRTALRNCRLERLVSSCPHVLLSSCPPVSCTPPLTCFSPRLCLESSSAACSDPPKSPLRKHRPVKREGEGGLGGEGGT